MDDMDPISETIKRHESALEAYKVHVAIDPPDDDREVERQWDEMPDDLCDAVMDSFKAVVGTKPTTHEGYLEKTRALVNEDDPLDFAGLTEALLECAVVLHAG
jgi:hypothetical protein